VQAASRFFAVPLTMRISEGLVWSNRNARTLLDKILNQLTSLALSLPYYFVADAYYAAGKTVVGLVQQGDHLSTRARSNATAYMSPVPSRGLRKRGRPKIYRKKVHLARMFKDCGAFQEAPSPVYGERNVTIEYRVCDLIWRPARRVVRFVLVVHPVRGKLILMCTDTSLKGPEIIRLCGLRFRIEQSFKQAST
jgi:hypothetical protein